MRRQWQPVARERTLQLNHASSFPEQIGHSDKMRMTVTHPTPCRVEPKNVPKESAVVREKSDPTGRHPATLQIPLVIILRPVVRPRCRNLGGYRFIQGRLPYPDGFFGSLALCLVVIKNGRTVLPPHVRALTVYLRGIVVFEKYGQQFFVGHSRWVKRHTDNLSVVSLVRADFLVGRVFGMSAGVSDFNIDDTFDVTEYDFGRPETAHGKRGYGKLRM